MKTLNNVILSIALGMSLMIAVSVAQANEVNAYVSLYNANTICGECTDQPKEHEVFAAFGMAVGYVGIELLVADKDMGASLYLQTKPLTGLKLYTGISSLPDTAIVAVPTYGNIQDSTNVNALMIGIDYKLVTLRYYVYDAEHNITQSTYDNVNNTRSNFQTGSTSYKKSSVWLGVTHEF